MRANATNDSTVPPKSITRQAAEWLVRLSADDISPAARAVLQADFEKWQQADSRHALVAQKMAGIIQQARHFRHDTAGTTPARAAIEKALKRNRAHSRNKNLVLGLVICIMFVTPAWLMVQNNPLPYLLADVRSAGEWKSQQLADQSQITLNGSSAVNIVFNAAQRQLELVRGAVLVDVAADPARPFIVQTRHGRIRALGTRFVVTLDDETTTLTMLASRTYIQSIDTNDKITDALTIDAGQQVRMSVNGISAVEQIDVHAISDAWKFRHLVVENRPLAQVLDELSRYHAGFMYYDRAAFDNMRVSAVLPLDDTEKAMQLLARSFPLRIRSISPWLFIIEKTEDVHANSAVH